MSVPINQWKNQSINCIECYADVCKHQSTENIRLVNKDILSNF